MLDQLKAAVLAANLRLPSAGLVRLTWGNVSGRDNYSGLVVIKPSGVPYEQMGADDMVVVDGEGRLVEGKHRPSTDTPTHLALYRGIEGIAGIVHTHSTWATAWAQAHRPVPVLGTTHADLCPGPVMVTRPLTREEVEGEYEKATGTVILELTDGRSTDEVPAVLVDGHGPFCWGKSPAHAVEIAETVEEVAKMAWLSVALAPDAPPIAAHVVARHFSRKHGPNAYYGQGPP
ncbi:MAG TPA: L-ribulose-5-phosphate 4-epimerase AraD [Acidimicrobiales bacterium]|nr:L-ribulose-5-phosphate 4-epimerase AraD [Acidimicrobiales bacterium]